MAEVLYCCKLRSKDLHTEVTRWPEFAVEGTIHDILTGFCYVLRQTNMCHIFGFRIPLLITVGRRVGLKYSRRGRLILPLYSSCPPYFAAPLGRDLGDDANHSPANSCFSNIIPTSFTFNLPSAGTYMCNVSLPRAFGLFFFHEV